MAPLVADPPPVNSTTYANTRPLNEISDTMVNLISGRIDKFWKRRTQLSTNFMWDVLKTLQMLPKYPVSI